MPTDLTSTWYLYNLAGDPVAYKTAKFVISEGFIPHILGCLVRPWPGAIIRWIMVRGRTRVPLTLVSYS
ncbi:hypothetical protein LCGC14_1897610, partial [marine sediment metagenome]